MAVAQCTTDVVVVERFAVIGWTLAAAVVVVVAGTDQVVAVVATVAAVVPFSARSLSARDRGPDFQLCP